jgi:hypothetical protein
MLAQRRASDEPERGAKGGTYDRRGEPWQKGGEGYDTFQDIKSILSIPLQENDGDYWRGLDEDSKGEILHEHNLLTGLEDGWDWDQLSPEARDKIRELSNEGGKGSGKAGHRSWMKGMEEDPKYKACPNCNIVTEQIGGKCRLCGKKV